MTNHLVILGTRGVPARYGGFETFAEKLALNLSRQNWTVTVFGQDSHVYTKQWHGINCIYLKRRTGLLRYLDPILYDLQAIWQTRKVKGTVLTLGYNTALFNMILWLQRRRQIINMDGIEWKRSKYKNWHEKFWLKFNEWIALKIADICIADHAEIARYLQKRSPKTQIVTLAYGADTPDFNSITPDPLFAYNLQPFNYGLVIARAEPENQIHTLIAAWKKKNALLPLVILGNYDDKNQYHRQIKSIADDSIKFIGAVFDQTILNSLKHYCAIYLHGHTVGGTNPSLLEALAAGCPVIAHDNVYNRGVADDAALYFLNEHDLAEKIDGLLKDDKTTAELKQKARQRHQDHYQWQPILAAYQQLLGGSAQTHQ